MARVVRPVGINKGHITGGNSQSGFHSSVRDYITRTANGEDFMVGHTDAGNTGQSWEDGKKIMLATAGTMVTLGAMEYGGAAWYAYDNIVGYASIADNIDNVTNLSNNIQNERVRYYTFVFKSSIDLASFNINLFKPIHFVFNGPGMLMDGNSIYEDYLYYKKHYRRK